ncbi:hypothetical protein PSTG_03443 [Puccinia striiformis f. sp. tritici PST-78]|uniref:Uncharacterized protein n=1 Tax=Puccinia striiformis f. sp. tritici PST-78 TaxID=1165861 RepID=A0A0L0VWF5_9BASI|nr:hypothetical protein PSTG_03443 [Puccinia striiformis f. sp. tritici PST-78]
MRNKVGVEIQLRHLRETSKQLRNLTTVKCIGSTTALLNSAHRTLTSSILKILNPSVSHLPSSSISFQSNTLDSIINTSLKYPPSNTDLNQIHHLSRPPQDLDFSIPICPISLSSLSRVFCCL